MFLFANFFFCQKSHRQRSPQTQEKISQTAEILSAHVAARELLHCESWPFKPT
jgi:hypothetical protein